ncbi:sec-24-like membrane protein involved in ER to Golgi vesicular transport [Scheffersomyces stipitis CBS 6054]|uniref:Sec-24-like membrane protein involved in ER to Golgi vesicular transport n=1 Tax=Scheffersomyces stipitis (strain ATCC 58785 / CBS 6054 / NBRC 10063 / NRRL Y-11545) TaxID=322104 RepID=A3LN83_PICST|nr:sec-24-like membrane protein involved in ER to Golgi vesicular transport [Scheffersomyces stipitis CBS 6054]ABN64813.2 sec-24-like membrane protein involved in ER to Golgi vesicular transport [Scheffersomyces stipitis CBS 6054]
MASVAASPTNSHAALYTASYNNSQQNQIYQQNPFQPSQNQNPYQSNQNFPNTNNHLSSAPVPKVLRDMNHLSQENEDLSLQQHRYANQVEYTSANDAGEFRSFYTFQNVSPPEATSQFHAVDQGTSSSKFIRSTMYYVPESESLRAATKLPISVTIRPFAPLLASEEPVPLVDMKRDDIGANDDPLSKGPIRCRRCRTYVNPSFQFTNDGKFMCNICQFPNNVVPDDYASVLDGQGYRIDRLSRPELHKGVYDLLVPDEYNFGGPEVHSQPLHHIFLIDISEQSVKQNLPVIIADAIRATLYTDDYDLDNYDPNEPETPNKRVKQKFAFIAFDKSLHFFNLSPTLESTQVVISSDLEDPFVPFSEGMFVDAEESKNVIEDALNQLESFCSQETVADSETCFLAACRTAMLCLEAVGGGKITSILSTLPTWGPGALKYKDNKNVGRSPAPLMEKRLYSVDNEYIKLLGRDFVEKNVGLDVHVISPTSVDLSNIGWLSSITGGTISRSSNFNFERDGRSLTAKIINSIKKASGYQGQLKLRCSNGLQVSQYYGTSSSIADTSVVGSVQDPVIPVLNEDQTFTILLEYDGKLSTKLDCHFQAALLYTDPDGVRKVRVINLVVAVTERLEDAFNFADENAIVTTIVRDTLSFVGKQPLTELRESVNSKLVEIFTQYRAMSEYGHNTTRTLTNQLLFPDSLVHLPIYLLAFIKSKAIRDSTAISSDVRLADLYQMLSMPIERLMYLLYPALIELHSISEEEAEFEPTNGFFSLPKSKEVSASHLQKGVYILCDGMKVYVWVHPESNMMLVKDLFGDQVESVEELNPLIDELPELPTHISEQARNIVKYFQTYIVGDSSLESAGIRLVRPGIDGVEHEFRELLVEDSLRGSMATNSSLGYPEYLSNLHKAIRVKLDNDSSSNKVKQSVTNAENHHDTLAQRLIHF